MLRHKEKQKHRQPKHEQREMKPITLRQSNRSWWSLNSRLFTAYNCYSNFNCFNTFSLPLHRPSHNATSIAISRSTSREAVIDSWKPHTYKRDLLECVQQMNHEHCGSNGKLPLWRRYQQPCLYHLVTKKE